MRNEVRLGRWCLRKWASKPVTVSRTEIVFMAAICGGGGALALMILTWIFN